MNSQRCKANFLETDIISTRPRPGGSGHRLPTSRPREVAPNTYTPVFMLGYSNAMTQHAEAKVSITK